MRVNYDLIKEAMLDESEPIDCVPTMKDENWQYVMNEEIKVIEKNKIQELVHYSRMKTIDVRWVYKLKFQTNGEISKHTVRLVTKGFLQKPGIDFNEVWALVSRVETIRLVVDITPYRGWKMHQLDEEKS